MGRSRQYSDKEKASVLLLLEAAGYPNENGAMQRVHKRTGIPYNSIKAWAQRGIKQYDDKAAGDIAELIDETRVELTELFDREIRAIFKDMLDKREDATYRDLTIAAGIITDKLQLLNDKPTQNIQQAISFERRGISTLPEHLTPGSVGSITGSQEV